jgi:hypothetical protein
MGTNRTTKTTAATIVVGERRSFFFEALICRFRTAAAASANSSYVSWT